MRFCDKLPKLRKNNNYSQEQLADKLNVSRQAVSKWEMGSSYPDMDKMLQMCKILNCNLEDLMDDGVIGENVAGQKNSKSNINTYMKDFLNFITKSYNMFCSMKFKEKIKLIFEMACICGILAILGAIILAVMESFIVRITGNTNVGYTISNTLTSIFAIMLEILGFIIALHLFKIRYLDYFVTIEDQNVIEKTIEEPIEKKESKYYNEKPKEKVIIRDAKHSTFSFFDVLGKIILIMIKIFVIMCTIPIVALFVFLVVGVIMSLFHIQYGILFFWGALALLGTGLLIYTVIEWVYNFVANQKQHVKRIFIVAIIGLILTGVGIGVSICTYLSYDKAGDYKEDYQTQVVNLPVNDTTVFNYNGYQYEYKIDNTVQDIQLEIKHMDSVYNNINSMHINGYEEYYLHYNISFSCMYKLVLSDLKNRVTRDYSNLDYITVTVTMSQETKGKLDDNYNKLQEERYKEDIFMY